MSATIAQEELLRQLRAATERDTKRARALALDLDADRMRRRPPTGGWSVSEVYEHLCITNDSYLVMIAPLADRSGSPTTVADAQWKPTLMGGFMTKQFESPRKIPAPRSYRPGPEAREGVVDAFIDRQRQLLDLLERTKHIDWSRTRLGSPVTKLIRFNLGDCFRILVAHTHRHLGQIERIRAGIGAPSHSSS